MENNFKFYRLGSIFNNMGSGIFSIFILWAIHAIFGNLLYTGLIGFALAIPFALSVFLGPFVDKTSKVLLLRISIFAKFLILGAFFIVPSHFNVGIAFYLVFALLFSLAGVFSSNSGSAFLPLIVEKDNLAKANSSMQFFGIIVGLLLGVFLYFATLNGMEFRFIFAINSIVFLISFVFNLFLKNPLASNEEHKNGYFDHIKNASSFFKKGALLHLLLAFLLVGSISQIASVNMPLLVDTFFGEAQYYVLIVVAGTVGAALGAIIFGFMANRISLNLIIFLSFLLAGVFKILFIRGIEDGNLSRVLWMMALSAGFTSVISLLFHTLKQSMIKTDFLATANAMNTSLFQVMVAIGAVIGGFSNYIFYSIENVFFAQGIAFIVIGVLLFLSKPIKNLKLPTNKIYE
ncbi:MAG: MFS transporter [Defluviitaleaceae bacterium]|nr:MFS transporter [Defluviitaleaceae bacterium]